MVESLPTMVDTHIKEQVKKQVPEQVRDQVPVYVAEGLILERQKTKEEMEWMIAKAILQERGNIQAEISSQIHNVIDNHIPSQVDASDDPHDDAHPEGENSNQEQVDDYDFWTDSYASDDDEIPMKQVSQDIMEEVSLTIDEAKLKKMADEMLRQRCTSGDEHQYDINQMRNFLKSDIVWVSRKEILVSPHPRKTTPLVQSCQRDPEAPPLSLINQDLLYLKKGSSGPEKIVLSLHKFPVIIFNDDDIKERTSRWKQKEPGKTKEEVYLNSKIIQVIKTYWELGHEHKFITEIVARRANECIVSIIEPDYKNISIRMIFEDMYLLIMMASLNKLIECHIVDNCKKGLGYKNYNAVPPSYIGNFMPPKPDLSFTGLDEFVNEPVVENCKAMSSEEEPKVVRKNNDAPIIKEWVSDDKEEDVSQPKIE
ncbi:hypothetical protein Tco_0353206 [Tanacetum coccineum]